MTTQVLDHGYIKLIEHWGSDERIIEAARMSTDKGFRTWAPYCECTKCGVWILYGQEAPQCFFGDHDWRDVPKGDEGLLTYLYKNTHATPFEFAGAVIEVQAPIFVFREWHRHRTQSYNEMSARYTPLPDMNYIPTVERLMLNVGTSNKQAGTAAGAAVLNVASAQRFQTNLARVYERDETLYQEALAAGVPKELARIHLPVGRYSRMRASANLRNWLGFLTLRMAPNAQHEIRVYANALHDILKPLFPRTMELFDE